MARKMKDSGVEWIGKIPEDWGMIRGKTLFTQRSEKGNSINLQLLSPTQKYGVIPQSLYEELSGMKAVKIEENTDLTQFKSIYEGDFCISLRSFQGGFEYSHYNGVVSPAYQVFYKKAELIDSFYRYLFKDQGFITKMGSLTKTFRDGKSISFTDFSNSYIPYPCIEEQKRISEELDRKCRSVDSIIDKTRASIEEYKKLRQAVITQAVTKGVRGNQAMKDSGVEYLGSIPSDWGVTRIKWLLSERKEKSESGMEEPLSMSQKYGLIPTKKMDNIPNMASSFVGAKIVYSGDLVFNKLKAHLGVFAVSQYDGLVSPDYAVYHSTGLGNIRYLQYLFKTQLMINEFKKKSTGVGAGLTRLYTPELYSIHIPYPSIQEQQQIADFIDVKSASIDRLIQKKEQYLVELETMKKSLIYEYVTGKKEV